MNQSSETDYADYYKVALREPRDVYRLTGEIQPAPRHGNLQRMYPLSSSRDHRAIQRPDER
jgi:hypothetical protein